MISLVLEFPLGGFHFAAKSLDCLNEFLFVGRDD
jgi:hypothetical protein